MAWDDGVAMRSDGAGSVQQQFLPYAPDNWPGVWKLLEPVFCVGGNLPQ